jgi:hypothetical protein
MAGISSFPTIIKAGRRRSVSPIGVFAGNAGLCSNHRASDDAFLMPHIGICETAKSQNKLAILRQMCRIILLGRQS